MKFGIFDHVDIGRSSLEDVFRLRLDLAEAYERAGFHAYHVAEHHSTPLGVASSPSVLLAAMTQRTRTLRLGPLVYMLSLYHPLRALEEICMLDQMSGGRLELGVGRGVNQFEIGYYGVDPKQSQEIYVEGLQVILKGLEVDRLTHEGKHFRFRDVPVILKPLQRPRPPIWYGVSRPEGTTFPAKSKWNVVCLGTAEGVKTIIAKYKREWGELGYNPAELPFLGTGKHLVVAETDAEAVKTARRAYRVWYENYMYIHNLNNSHPVNVHFPDNFDDAQAGGWSIAGSPETVYRSLAEHIADTGINYFISWTAFGDLSKAECLRTVELFSTKVMPRLSRPAAEVAAQAERPARV